MAGGVMFREQTFDRVIRCGTIGRDFSSYRTPGEGIALTPIEAVAVPDIAATDRRGRYGPHTLSPLFIARNSL